MKEPKTCAKCGGAIPSADVVLAASEDERCHDCADYCEDPDCPKCPHDDRFAQP